MRTGAWVGSACWLLALGCTSVEELPATDAGVEEAGPDAVVEGGGALQGTMQCGDIPVSTDACGSCADEHCCDAGEACRANPGCVALRNCLAACPSEDAACAKGCAEANPTGDADNKVLSACRMRHCGGECFEDTTGACGFQLPPSECNDCAQSFCCEVGWVSNTEPSFWTYQDCVATCTTAACFADCDELEPEGRSFYMAFVGCLGTYCAEGCGVQPAATCGGFYGDACGACVSESCCDASVACLLSPACQRLRACVAACGGDASCVADCKAAEPSGADAFSVFDACLGSSCAGMCP